MIDTLTCPICNKKLKNRYFKNKYVHEIDKLANFTSRYCNSNFDHNLQFLIISDTKEVVLLRTSIDNVNLNFIEIDFLNNKSIATLYKNNTIKTIAFNKLIEPDFPNLTSLKERVSILSSFL